MLLVTSSRPGELDPLDRTTAAGFLVGISAARGSPLSSCEQSGLLL
jgi:hypothetical protein